MLNKFEKESLIIKLLEEGWTVREIAKEAHASPETIGEIKRMISGESASYTKKNKKLSKNAMALKLFSENKNLTEVSIMLDFDPKEVEKVYLDYLRMNRLSELVKIYQKLGGNHFQGLVKFYRSFTEAGVDNKIISDILDIAKDIPDLKHKIKQLQHETNELEVQILRKKENLQYLNGTIEKANNIIHEESSKLEDLSRQITNKRIDLWDIKKAVENIETTNEFLNWKEKLKKLLRIINQNPNNLHLLIIAVLETLVNNSHSQQIISDYSDTFKDGNIKRQNLQPREDLYYINIAIYYMKLQRNYLRYILTK